MVLHDSSSEEMRMPAFRRHVSARILRELEVIGGATRGELMTRLGISRTALTRVLDALFERGEVCEDEPALSGPSGRGRPPRVLRLRVRPRLTFALYVSRTTTSAAIVDETGRILSRDENEVGSSNVFDEWLTSIENLFAKLSGVTPSVIERCVAALPTMIDPAGARVMPAGAKDQMPSWAGVESAKRIAAAIGVPSRLENDGRLGALAEGLFGNSRGARTSLYVSAGRHGIGGGLLLGGIVYQGAGFAGEVSHIGVRRGGELCPCGRRGCVAAEVRAATQRLDVASSGDERRIEMSAIVDDLSEAVSGVINVIHPQTLVLRDQLQVSSGWNLFDLLQSAIRDKVHPDISKRLLIAPASSGADGVLRAAGVINDDIQD